MCAALPAHARIKKDSNHREGIAHVWRLFLAGSWTIREDRREGVRRARSNDPKNVLIVDLQLAPRNAEGKVEYSFDFYILKPIDLAKGNHKMLYERQTAAGKRSARSIVESAATIRVP